MTVKSENPFAMVVCGKLSRKVDLCGNLEECHIRSNYPIALSTSVGFKRVSLCDNCNNKTPSSFEITDIPGTVFE